MIATKFNDKTFLKDMRNIIDYSVGYFDGIERGKKEMYAGLGKTVKELLENYIDSSARVNPQALHHVYEWYQTGSPDARLFDIDYTISNVGLSVKSTFKQSSSVKDGSYEPFYNKAKIMEDGVPVTIKPKRSEVLAFEVDGETVFTPNAVTVESPGGDVSGEYQKIFDEFFQKYFSQAFLMSSGIGQYFKDQYLYKKNFGSAKTGGRQLGISTGYRWIANLGDKI